MPLEEASSSVTLCLAVMHPTVCPRGDEIVDMHVPQRADVGALVLLEQRRQAAGLRHRRAAQAEAGGGGGEVAAAVGGLFGRDAVGAELVHLGAIAAVVHDSHQHADALAADRLQL